jgi:hypothetical protein
MYVLLIVVCPFVHFILAIVLSVIFRYMDSDCPFGIFKLFLNSRDMQYKGYDLKVSSCDRLPDILSNKLALNLRVALLCASNQFFSKQDTLICVHS